MACVPFSYVLVLCNFSSLNPITILMKHLMLILCILAMLKPLPAQDSLRQIKSEIDAVTVFLNGAQVFRDTTITLKPGIQTLQVSGLPVDLDPASIQCGGEGEFTILSVSHQLNYLSEKPAKDQLESLESQRKRLNQEIEMDKTILDALRREEEVLLANQKIGGQQEGVDLARLKETATYFRTRIQEMNAEKLGIQRRIEEKREQARNFTLQLHTLNAPPQTTTSRINLTVEAKKETSAKLALSYIVNNAGWLPTYDLRIRDVESPMKLSYKARVFQRTQEDWKNVRLTLSTGNPSEKGTMPVVKPWYLRMLTERELQLRMQREQEITLQREIRSKEHAAERGMYRIGDEGNKEIARLEQQLHETENRMRSRDAEVRQQEQENQLAAQEMLRIREEIMRKQEQLERSREGQELSRMDADTRRSEEEQRKYEEEGRRIMEEIDRLQEKQKMQVLSRQKGEMNRFEKRSLTRDSLESLALMVNQLTRATHVEFAIEVPYTIPGDGKRHIVQINEHSLNSRYRYFCAPRLDENAYLTAQILDWEPYNLLPGEAHLFLEGTYVGKTQLNVQEVSDTLDISLGRDRDIVVTRTKLTEFNKTQSIGSNRKETRAWEIAISNRKRLGVTLVVVDQLPVSTDSQIEVTPIELGSARLDETTGLLTWELDFKGGEDRKFDFRYEVKYPKEMSIELE